MLSPGLRPKNTKNPLIRQAIQNLRQLLILDFQPLGIRICVDFRHSYLGLRHASVAQTIDIRKPVLSPAERIANALLHPNRQQLSSSSKWSTRAMINPSAANRRLLSTIHQRPTTPRIIPYSHPLSTPKLALPVPHEIVATIRCGEPSPGVPISPSKSQIENRQSQIENPLLPE
jgi:hypothetical protein